MFYNPPGIQDNKNVECCQNKHFITTKCGVLLCERRENNFFHHIQLLCHIKHIPNHKHHCEVRLNLCDFCLVSCSKLPMSGMQSFFQFTGLPEKKQNDENFSAKPGTLPVAGLCWRPDYHRRKSWRRHTWEESWCWDHRGKHCWSWKHCHHNQPTNPVWWNWRCRQRRNNNNNDYNNITHNINNNNITHNNNNNINNNNITHNNNSNNNNRGVHNWHHIC